MPHAENQIERMRQAMVWMHICLHLDSKEAKHYIDLQITQGHREKNQKEPRKNKQSPNPHTQSLAKTKDGQGNRNSLYHSPTSLAPSNKRHQSTADGEATHIDTASLWHGYDGASQSRWYSRNTEKDLLVPQTPLSGQVNSRPTAKGI